MVLGRRPSKTRGFLRFSNRPRDPLRTLGWSTFENSWFFAIFKSPARPSADFRLVGPGKLVVFLRFSNRSRDPLRSFAWSNRSRCGAALIFLKLRTFNRCRASGICSRAFLARAPNRGRAIGIASEALLIHRKLVFLRFSIRPRDPLRTLGWSTFENSWFFLRFSNRPRDPLRSGRPSKNSWFFAIFKSLARPSAEFRVVESLSLWRGAHFDEAARPKPLPSQWDLHQRKLAASSKPSPSHGNCF